MKLLCFVVLLIFGAMINGDLNVSFVINPNGQNSGSSSTSAQIDQKNINCAGLGVNYKSICISGCFQTNSQCSCVDPSSSSSNTGHSHQDKIQEDNNRNHQYLMIKFPGPDKTCVEQNYIITVFNISMMNTTDDGHLSDNDPHIDVFVPIEPLMNVPQDQKTVTLSTYFSAELFLSNSNTVLKSRVIGVEINGYNGMELKHLLFINFILNRSEPIPANQTLSCQFFNETALKWDDVGSFTNLSSFNNSSTVTCSYNHMTPFAVLLVDVDVTHVDPEQWKILSYITYIGCSISSFFSAVTIFLYTFMKSSNRDSSIHIHVSLSAAVFLLNTSFLFSEWGATWPQKSACVAIAVIIQYSLLSCFSWMAIEAVHLYLLLVKVFNTYIRHYMIKLSLFGWGVPALLVGGSLCVYDIAPFYGTVKKLNSNTNETTRFCWITDPYFLYGMNISYLSITFLFNTSVLVAVTQQIFKLHCTNVKGSKLPSRKDVCTVLCLTLLLGMTWGLAFFTLGYTNYFILYLFCISNSLQGLFLFLWFYMTMKRNKGLEAQHSVNTYETSFTQ